MLSSFFKVLALIFFSSLKLFYAAPIVIASGYSSIESFLILSSGGLIGVVFFYFLGGQVSIKISVLLSRFLGTQEKRVFSKKNRFIVRVKQTFGVFGIAFVTPVILSIPIGCIIAYSYYRNQSKTLPYLMLSVVFWTGVAVLFWDVFL